MQRRDLKSAKLQITNRKSQIRQRGYMMITLMLVVGADDDCPARRAPRHQAADLARSRRRDAASRHAYMRAIQHYYKKFGRYPNKVEDLENTNNMRFLRKRYTDPMTRDPVTGKEKDFKFLHQQDISLNNGPVLGGNCRARSVRRTEPGRVWRARADSGHKADSAVGRRGQGGFGGSQGGPEDRTPAAPAIRVRRMPTPQSSGG